MPPSLTYEPRRKSQSLYSLHSIPKLVLIAMPNLLIASVIFSSLAAANVHRKYIFLCSKFSLSAVNQLPLAIKAPWSKVACHISCSISSRVEVLAFGCLCQSTVNQICATSVFKKQEGDKISYKHASSWWIPCNDFSRQKVFTRS